MFKGSLSERVKRLEKKACCSKIYFYDDFDSFPQKGRTNVLYVDKENKEFYIWEEGNYIGGVDIPKNFISLQDTPNTYVGEGGKFLTVSEGEGGIEFTELTVEMTGLTTDESLYIDYSTGEIRSNIGQSIEKFEWVGGSQKFILADKPSRINYISVNGQILSDPTFQWDIDVDNKEVDILEDLDEGDIINISYNYIIVE